MVNNVADMLNILEIGQRVRLRHDPQRRGVVRARAERVSGGNRYQVAIGEPVSALPIRNRPNVLGDSSPWFIEEDLEPLAAEEPYWLQRDEFLRELLLIKLRFPLTDTLYGYRQSRTDFLEYQYLPVLKILENPDQRILIADEVGLGKTIEACYIYQELSARMPLDGVLVVCPSSLKNKWQQEFKEKFEVDFDILDGRSLRDLILTTDKSYYPHYFRAIVSYELIRGEQYQNLISDTGFSPDLLIFDEAHYMRNRNQTRNVGVLLADSAAAVVMLSATPLQTGNDNLFNLFQLMKPQDYENFNEFENVITPNTHLIQAGRMLRVGQARDALLHLRNLEQVTHYDYFRGNPDYLSVVDQLGALDGVDLSDAKLRHEVIRLQREILKLNTLSQIFQRTRKREVVYKTPEGVIIDPAERRARVIEVPLHESEAAFYQSLMVDAQEDLKRRRVRGVGFARTTRERMAASCLPALRQQCLTGAKAEMLVEKSVHDDWGWQNGLSSQGAASFQPGDEDAEYQVVKWTFSERSRRLAKELGEIDSKFDRLASLIIEILEQKPNRELGPSKILLFASYIGTLEYLYRRLKPLFEERGLRLEQVHGGVKNLDRLRIQEEFREETNFRLLLSSEVSSEGIDLQFCNTIINYDMPWNPMRIEQRIGRLDRYKQRNPVIRIINFYVDVDIDSRILYRLHERIGLFERSIGDLELILGPVIREIQQALLDPNMSEAEFQEFRKKKEDALISQRQIQEEYEERAAELLGSDLTIPSEIDDARATGRVIHSEEVRALLQSYLNVECRDSRLEPYQGTTQFVLHTGPSLSAKLVEFMDRRRRQGHPVPPISDRLKEALKIGGNCFITFDNEIAQRRLRFEFINYLHPLTQLACEYWARDYRGIPALDGLEIEADVKSEEEGYYYLFVMQEASMRPRRNLLPLIVTDDGELYPSLGDKILGLLHKGTDLDEVPIRKLGWKEASHHAFRWIDSQRDLQASTSRARNDSLLRARESGIRRQFSAMIERQHHLLIEAKVESIKRLRHGRITRLQAQQDERLRQLMGKREVSVSYELVATGRVRLIPIESGSANHAMAEVATLEETPKEKPKAKPTTISQRRKQRRKRKQRKRERRQAARP